MYPLLNMVNSRLVSCEGAGYAFVKPGEIEQFEQLRVVLLKELIGIIPRKIMIARYVPASSAVIVVLFIIVRC